MRVEKDKMAEVAWKLKCLNQNKPDSPGSNQQTSETLLTNAYGG